MTIKQSGVAILAGFLLAGLLYMKGCIAGRKTVSLKTASAALKPTDKEQVLIDPTRHTMTTITHSGTSQTTLPDRPSTVTIDNDGKVTLNTPQFGYEERPFVGYGFANKYRMAAGCDLLYWKRLDIGPAITFEPYHVFETMRIAVLVSYNVWSNTRVGVAVDHFGQVGGFITVRL